jgi:hypothetical protein
MFDNLLELFSEWTFLGEPIKKFVQNLPGLGTAEPLARNKRFQLA